MPSLSKDPIGCNKIKQYKLLEHLQLWVHKINTVGWVLNAGFNDNVPIARQAKFYCFHKPHTVLQNNIHIVHFKLPPHKFFIVVLLSTTVLFLFPSSEVPNACTRTVRNLKDFRRCSDQTQKVLSSNDN